MYRLSQGQEPGWQQDLFVEENILHCQRLSSNPLGESELNQESKTEPGANQTTLEETEERQRQRCQGTRQGDRKRQEWTSRTAGPSPTATSTPRRVGGLQSPLDEHAAAPRIYNDSSHSVTRRTKAERGGLHAETCQPGDTVTRVAKKPKPRPR